MGDPEGAKQTFQIIQQAYDVLSDPQVACLNLIHFINN